MPDRVNVETFQIRTNVNRLSVERGLAVTAIGEGHYIDPQVEPHHWTSTGPSDPKHLHIRLARGFNPGSEVTHFSVHPGFLRSTGAKELDRYRAYPAVDRPIGRAALISVVDHDTEYLGFLPPFGLNAAEASSRLDFYTKATDRFGIRSYGPTVGLALLLPGAGITVSQERGGYFSDVAELRYVYDPDSEEGLVFQHEPATPARSIEPPQSDSPGDPSGDREPRNPLGAPPALSEAMPLPQ